MFVTPSYTARTQYGTNKCISYVDFIRIWTNIIHIHSCIPIYIICSITSYGQHYVSIKYAFMIELCCKINKAIVSAIRLFWHRNSSKNCSRKTIKKNFKKMSVRFFNKAMVLNEQWSYILPDIQFLFNWFTVGNAFRQSQLSQRWSWSVNLIHFIQNMLKKLPNKKIIHLLTALEALKIFDIKDYMAAIRAAYFAGWIQAVPNVPNGSVHFADFIVHTDWFNRTSFELSCWEYFSFNVYHNWIMIAPTIK